MDCIEYTQDGIQLEYCGSCQHFKNISKVKGEMDLSCTIDECIKGE
jgi:hypothetical protein